MLNTAKVEIGAKAVVFGLGGIRLNGIQGLKMAGADRIIGVDLNDDKEEWGRRFGMTHFVNPKKLAERALIMQTIVDMTKTPFDRIGGADYSFDCTGNVKVMRDALECTHRGWGQSIIIAPMVRVMRRSIDLMEDIARETGNRIAMTRRGSLLAARQLVRVAPLEALEPHPLDPAHRVVAGPGLVHVAHLQPEEHVVQNRVERRQGLA